MAVPGRNNQVGTTRFTQTGVFPTENGKAKLLCIE